MQAKNLCFYLSDHGFGHIARNIPLIAEAVRRIDGYVYAVCGERHLEFAKANLLELLTPEQSSRIRYRAEHTDIGLILQQGTLLVDTAALTDACAQYLAELPERAKREADWLRQHDVAAALCDMFKEKPTQEVAKDYIAKGALWNGGVFAFKLGYVLNRAHELIDFVDYEDLFNKYDALNKISFDYAVVEHEPEIEVMRFAGTWKDLGTWNTLTEAMDSHAVGEAMFNEKCENPAFFE